MSDWYTLYMNDMCCMWMMKACMNLMSYKLDNVWDVVDWYIRYEKPIFNRDHLTSLLI